jgi:type IV secretory pathway VirB2 component (pilin)
MKTEKILTPFNGYVAIVIIVIIGALTVFGLTSNNDAMGFILLPIFILS